MDPRPNVLAPLRVVSRGRGEAGRPLLAASLALRVKLLDGHPETVGFAADFVQADEPVEPVERRILDPLGHDGCGHLLKLLHERALGFPARVVGVVGVSQEQDVPDEVEDREVGSGVAALREGDGHLDAGPVLQRDFRAAVHVGPIHRETGDHFSQRRDQTIEREVARVAILFGQPRKRMPENVQLARHRDLQNELLRLISQIGKGGALSGEGGIGRRQRLFVHRLNPEPADQIQELVAHRAVDGPLTREALPLGQDLLGDQVQRPAPGLPRIRRAGAIELFGRGGHRGVAVAPGHGGVAGEAPARHLREPLALEVLEIPGRIEQSVRVIEADARDLALFQKA